MSLIQKDTNFALFIHSIFPAFVLLYFQIQNPNAFSVSFVHSGRIVRMHEVRNPKNIENADKNQFEMFRAHKTWNNDAHTHTTVV